MPVVTGVARSAHAVVKHPFGRDRGQIEDDVVDEPFIERNLKTLKLRAQWLDPDVIFMHDVHGWCLSNFGGGCGSQHGMGFLQKSGNTKSPASAGQWVSCK